MRPRRNSFGIVAALTAAVVLQLNLCAWELCAATAAPVVVEQPQPEAPPCHAHLNREAPQPASEHDESRPCCPKPLVLPKDAGTAFFAALTPPPALPPLFAAAPATATRSQPVPVLIAYSSDPPLFVRLQVFRK